MRAATVLPITVNVDGFARVLRDLGATGAVRELPLRITSGSAADVGE